jgi:hypothetical protein
MHGAFERGQCLIKVASVKEQETDCPRSTYEARGVRNGLGNLQSLAPKSTAPSEGAQLSMTAGKPGSGMHGRQSDFTKALADSCPIEKGYGFPETVDRLTIVALRMVGEAETPACLSLQDNVSAGPGERQAPLASGNGLVIYTAVVEMD